MTPSQLKRYRRVHALAEALDAYVSTLSEEEGRFFLQLATDGVRPDDVA